MGNRRSLWQTTAVRFIVLLLTFSSMKALDPAVNANEPFLSLEYLALGILHPAAVRPHA